MKSGIGLEVPSTPNKPLGRGPEDQSTEDADYVIYEHMEPNTPIRTRRIKHYLEEMGTQPQTRRCPWVFNIMGRVLPSGNGVHI